MRRLLTPRRRRAVEYLDDPALPADVRDRAMGDVVRSNLLFGGTRAVMLVLRDVLRRMPVRATLLDVGTGLADIPARARDEARQLEVDLTTIGLDRSETLARSARLRVQWAVCGDAVALPLARDSVDVVTCSQLLHHFEEAAARTVIAELHRVARDAIVISDLHRSWLAAGGFWTAAAALRFHPVTRHDGVVSVLRGFTERELESLVRDATGVTPTVNRGAFWRLTAVWFKTASGQRSAA